MATPAQIEEQVQLERDAIAQGLRKLKQQTRQLEEKSYASASIYGVASIDTLLPLVVKRIEETTSRIHERQNGRAFKEIAQYLSDVEPLAAAAIVCKVTFDRVFSKDDDASHLAKVLECIGQAVENECHMRHYEAKAPGLLHTIKENYWHRSCGTQQRLVVVRTMMNRVGIEPWQNWGSKNRTKLGGWLLDCLMQASGWFEKAMVWKGTKSTTHIAPTPEFLKIKDEVMANAELFSPEAWPMLIPPNDWEEGRSGGYLLNEVMHGHDMVRRSNHSPIQGETIYQFLNKIQSVGMRLNPFIVCVAEDLYERGVTVGKFIPMWEEPEPFKPLDIEDFDIRKDYRRRKAEWHNRMNDNAKKSVRTRKTMEAVRRYKDRERFYLPHSLDYRGRVYPIPAYLTQQDTDFGKSLLQFADASFMTPLAEDWLAFQVGTTYGLDKEPIHARIKWAKENHELISRISIDPVGCLPEWEKADEPWMFLAACEEYHHCIITCDRSHTSLPVAVDATASGLQILAGLARDASTASIVNVLPSDKPADAYRAVAEHASSNCPPEWREHVDRSVAKRLVMTLCYSAKFKSNWGYVKDALIAKGLEPPKDVVTEITKALIESAKDVFPGPIQVMRWIEREVSAATKRGVTEFEWVTPSGFVAKQRFMKVKTERVDLQLLGRCQVNVAVDETDTVDKTHHRNATSANLIHSLDASLLHLSCLRFDAPVSLIHDSVLCRATDMSALSAVLRETYMHLFAEHDYLSDWAKQIGAETAPPIIGTLNPESVIDSTYFFC